MNLTAFSIIAAIFFLFECATQMARKKNIEKRPPAATIVETASPIHMAFLLLFYLLLAAIYFIPHFLIHINTHTAEQQRNEQESEKKTNRDCMKPYHKIRTRLCGWQIHNRCMRIVCECECDDDDTGTECEWTEWDQREKDVWKTPV